MKIFSLFCLLMICACGKGRNFEGSPEPFSRPSPEALDSFRYIPEYLFDFGSNQSGFDFNIFLRSSDGFQGSSLTVKVNQRTGRVTLGNVNFGDSNCRINGQLETCDVHWMTSTPYYNFDVSRYKLSYEIKPIVSVLKVETNETANFLDCVLDPQDDFTTGQRLKVTLTDSESLQKKEIIFFNFGTQNFSSFVNPILPDVRFYYAFDFEKFFESTPYFFDSFDARKAGELFLYRIAARSLDDMNSTFVNYCLYDMY